LALWVGNMSVSSPAAGSTVTGVINVVGTAAGYLNLEIKPASTGALLARTTPNAAGAFSAAIDTTLLPGGSQTLNINAWDAAPGQPYNHTAKMTHTFNVQAARGATVPFVIYEAESATLTAATVVAGTARVDASTGEGQMAFEARGKKVVNLNAANDSIQFN